MSFQLYLQSFSGGQPSGFTREALRNAFDCALVELEDDYWQTDFGAASRTDLFLAFLEDGSDRIHSISLDHASTDDRLWRAIWILLGMPGSIFHYPGSPAPFARDPGAAAALPPALLASLGKPSVISEVRTILEAAMAARDGAESE